MRRRIVSRAARFAVVAALGAAAMVSVPLAAPARSVSERPQGEVGPLRDEPVVPVPEADGSVGGGSVGGGSGDGGSGDGGSGDGGSGDGGSGEDGFGGTTEGSADPSVVAEPVAPAEASQRSAVGGPTWIVTVGDSAISGEAGRWAGNTNQSSSKVDALGSTAYFDNASGTAEQIAGCHRSRSAEVHIGGGVMSKNLACSGARTYTQTPGSGDFKPGLDFFSDTAGRKGQALMLREFASSNHVGAVTVLIGANNFGFADIVQRCVQNWLLSPSWWPNYCHDDSSVSSRFTASAVAARTNEVAGGIMNIRNAMAQAGYADSSYTIFVQTYAPPIPRGSQFRYSQSGYTRQNVGGCGVWNRDADWANDVAVVRMNQALTNGAAQTGLSNIKVLNMSQSLNGRRLCENTVGLLEERGVNTWQSAGAVDNTEWVSQIRTVTTVFGPYQFQEGLHPSYWGQLALRNCLRQAWNGGVTRAGNCVRTASGLNGSGEPNMTLQ